MTPAGIGMSLSVPPSQNTAEVQEFRCMFTHDLRRKQKRWQDGFLSYHLFNKRVIVFDDSRNRIGDAYWRGEEEFNEGAELKLQQGALVDVQDKLGSKEQDITGVIANKDTGKAAPVPLSKPSPWKAITTIGPSGSGPRTDVAGVAAGYGNRPKSLKEVLGTPMGSLGGARIPESPVEQRRGLLAKSNLAREPVVLCGPRPPYASNPIHPAETPRPKKRQNPASSVDDNPKTPKRSKAATPSAGDRRPKTSKATSVPTNHAASPIVIESDEEPVDFTPARPPTTIPRPSKSATSRKSKASTAPSAKKPSPKPRQQPSLEPQSPARAARTQIERTVSPTAAAEARASSVLRERPVNILKSANSQPRRKIMYRDLLPKNFVHRRGVSQSMSNSLGRTPSAASRPSTSKERPRTSASSARHSPKQPTPRRNSTRSITGSLTEIEALARLDSAPKTPVDTTTTPVTILEEDEFVLDEPALDADTIMLLENEPTFAGVDQPMAASKPQPPPPPTAPWKLDEELTLAELDQALVASKRQQALRAAASREKQANAQARESPRRGPLQRIQTEPALNSPDAAQRRRSPLKKTTSDTTGGKGGPPEPVVVDGARGPWSREAFDLFGWRKGEPKTIRTMIDIPPI